MALIAGAAIFWLSISLWTRDRLAAPDVLAASCVHQADPTRLHQHPERARSWLAFIAVSHAEPPFASMSLSRHVAEMLVDRFGFLFVPADAQMRMIDSMRRCGAR